MFDDYYYFLLKMFPISLMIYGLTVDLATALLFIKLAELHRSVSAL